MIRLEAVHDVDAACAAGSAFDAVVLVSADPSACGHEAIASVVRSAEQVDQRAGSAVALRVAPRLCGGRLVVAPTGPVNRDQDDVRRFADAARDGLRRARDAGARKPFVLIDAKHSDPALAHAVEVALLGGLGGLWQPLEAREALGDDTVEPIQSIGWAAAGGADEPTTRYVSAVESGRRVARDLCGTEPERMAPPRFAEYCVQAFEGTKVQCTVLDNQAEIIADYPLLAGVARASQPVPRHQPRVIRLEYSGPGKTERTLLLAGKGLTYDTGGADVKAGGAMAGMSRDKGGGAAVAGLVHAIAGLEVPGVRVIAEIGAVRNSIGAECFVTDEIIAGHAGCRVRIGNTDAEGRLVLADLLSHLREDALQAVNPLLFSVATLTGHSGRAVGPYSIALDNGPALEQGIAQSLQTVGDLWGDPFDISRLRREDWDFVQPRTRADDTLSCNNAPSTMTARGHQFPMAFLAIASGLDHHGRDSDKPLPFTHIDIGGSACEGGSWQHGAPTAAPVVAMLQALAYGTST